MKLHLFFVIMLTASATLLAQEPTWLDPEARFSNWPEDQYLTAFATEVLSKNQSETEAQSKLYEVVKSQISDAILVSINAQTSLNITVENADTDEKLERRSSSSSEVELVGLKLDSYFNKRKKSLFVFGYVSLDDLAQYHRKNILDKSQQIDQNLIQASQTAQKSEKIKLYVDNKRLLSDVQKSVRLLTALSEQHGADVSQLQQKAAENNELLELQFHSGQVTIGHLITRINGELLNAIPKGTNIAVQAGNLSYSSSEQSSEFSEALLGQLSTTLAESPKISLSNASTDKIEGTFIQNESETTFNMYITKGSEAISTMTFNVNSSSINTKGMKLLPPNFEMIPDLASISIDGPKKFTIKPSEYTTQPIQLTYSIDGQPLTNLAVIFTLENDGKSKSYEAVSNAEGIVSFNLDEGKVIPGTDYLVDVSIDLPSFLSLDVDNAFLEYILDNQRIPNHTISLGVSSPTVYISSSEIGINGPLTVKVLEPAVKSGLANLRFAFITDQSAADYVLAIEANARKGQAGEIATLTFVDATISLVNRQTGKEIYKNSFFNIKGIGANFDVAQSSAFEKARTQMVDDITYELEYNR
jgi:hypothetical protein